MGEAAAQTTASDYKALVCVFLYGGNDYGNTLIPYDSSNYAAYQTIRTGIALPHDTLLPLTPSVALPSGRQMAFAPEWSALKTLFDAGELGVLLNVGTLIQPTTLAQYKAASVPLPPKLFSHNDQQSVWQSSLPEGATSGWGGRIADLFLAGNSTATFTCVNVSGNAVFMSGHSAVQYQVGPGGAVALAAAKSAVYGSQACSDALKALTAAPRANLFENELATIMNRATSAEATLSAGLAGAAPLNTAFDSANPLAVQLQMVARMIGVRIGPGRAAPGVLRFARRLRQPRLPAAAASRAAGPGVGRDQELLRRHGGTGRGRRGDQPSPPPTSAARYRPTATAPTTAGAATTSWWAARCRAGAFTARCPPRR